MAANYHKLYLMLLRLPSVPAPYPLRLFTGCLTVFGRSGVGAGTERVRRGDGEAMAKMVYAGTETFNQQSCVKK